MAGSAVRVVVLAVAVALATVAAPSAGRTVARTAVPHTQLLPPLVSRVAGPARADTAVAAARAGFLLGGARTVVLASSSTFADALPAGVLAAALQAPLLLVGDQLHRSVAAELDRLDATDVVVAGAVGAVPLVVQEDLAAAGLAVRRIAGDGRFDTGALLARATAALVPPTGHALVASGEDFPDALAAAPLAAVTGATLALTGRDALPADTAEALAALGVTRSTVLGGRAAVGDGVLAELPEPARVGGTDRYATSAAVAAQAVSAGVVPATVVVATGRDFPDALAGGALAAAVDGVLLLVDGHDPTGADATFGFLDANRETVGRILVMGGPAAVTEPVLDRLRNRDRWAP